MAKAAKKATNNTASKAASKKADTKAPAKKATAEKKTAPKKAAKKKEGGTANAAFMAPLQPSPALAEVIGSKPVPRTEMVKKIWDYIKENDLQDAKNKRMINADEKLQPLFGKKQISMFELAKIVNDNIVK